MLKPPTKNIPRWYPHCLLYAHFTSFHCTSPRWRLNPLGLHHGIAGEGLTKSLGSECTWPAGAARYPPSLANTNITAVKIATESNMEMHIGFEWFWPIPISSHIRISLNGVSIVRSPHRHMFVIAMTHNQAQGPGKHLDVHLWFKQKCPGYPPEVTSEFETMAS